MQGVREKQMCFGISKARQGSRFGAFERIYSFLARLMLGLVGEGSASSPDSLSAPTAQASAYAEITLARLA